jgi:hypothetical protein
MRVTGNIETKNFPEAQGKTDVDRPRAARAIYENQTEPIPRANRIKSCCGTSSPQLSHRTSSNTSSVGSPQKTGRKPNQWVSIEDDEYMEQRIMDFIRAKNLYQMQSKLPALVASISFLLTAIAMVIMFLFTYRQVSKMSTNYWFHVQNSVTGLCLGIIL